jgi:dTDP-4-amino-4,6-dideoxygalactose transaminase
LAVFQSGEYRKKLSADQAKNEHEFLNAPCPVTDDAYENTVWLGHRTLLGTEQDVAEIVEAVKKIQSNSKELTK